MMLHTVQSLYNTPNFNMNVNLTHSCCVSQFFYHGILQRNYRKMTIKWSFSYSFVKLSLYNKIDLQPIPKDLKHSAIKGLHCTKYQGSVFVFGTATYSIG